MEFKINGKDKVLNFGVRFVAGIDETEKYESESVSFGMGLMMAQEKLKMGNFKTLATVIKHALHQESVTEDEVFAAIDDYAGENELETLFDKIENEIKNSNAVRTAQARMEKMTQTANRAQAVKRTKK